MPNPALMFPDDPAQAALYAKLFGNKSSMGDSPNAFVNQQVVDAQKTPPPQDPNFDPGTLGQQQTPPPVPSRSPASVGAANAVANRGAKTKSENSIYDVLSEIDDNPAFKAQQGALSDYEKQVKDYINKKPGFQNLNLNPLLSLADAWNPGSHMAATYQAPESPEEHNLKAAQMGANLEQRQGDVAKTQLDLLKDKLNAFVGIDKSNKEMAPMMAMMQERMDNMNHLRNVNAVKGDPEINRLYGNSRNIANSLSAFDQTKVGSPQQFKELQNTIRQNLGLTSKSGVDERGATYFNSSAEDIARAKQYLFNEPVDIKEDVPEMVNHLKDVVGTIQKNNMQQMHSRINQRISGFDSMYQRPENAGRYQDLMNLKDATTNMFAPQNLAPGAAGAIAGGSSPQAQPTGGPKPRLSFEEFKARRAAGTL